MTTPHASAKPPSSVTKWQKLVFSCPMISNLSRRFRRKRVENIVVSQKKHFNCKIPPVKQSELSYIPIPVELPSSI